MCRETTQREITRRFAYGMIWSSSCGNPRYQSLQVILKSNLYCWTGLHALHASIGMQSKRATRTSHHVEHLDASISSTRHIIQHIHKLSSFEQEDASIQFMIAFW